MTARVISPTLAWQADNGSLSWVANEAIVEGDSVNQDPTKGRKRGIDSHINGHGSEVGCCTVKARLDSLHH